VTPASVFWIAAFLLFYAYAGYGLLMAAWARLRPRPVLKRRIEPRLSVVIAAHDEAETIGPRIANLLALDYPLERLEILIGSDGSTDATAARARAYEGLRVRVFEFTARRGKPSVLNDLVPEATGDLVVLADARQRFERGALRALVAPFADARIGAVSGTVVFPRDAAGRPIAAGSAAYRRLEASLRIAESRVDSAIGATGAAYALRRDLFEPLPPDTVLDDVFIPMRIARRGFRVVFEPRARALDQAPRSPREEFTRKVRTLAGNLQLLLVERWLLDPRRNRLFIQTVSHKALRLFGPFLLFAMLAASLRLAGQPIYTLALLGQALFYGAALAGHLLGRRRRVPRLLSLPFTFCVLNGAALVAVLRFAAGRQRVTWKKATA
jgi:cellulose synthase/poly-beta-1,6-N-acetylglucosamine synthase-like glycosyltransferase